MKIEVRITVSRSGSRYGDPKIQKEMLLDVPDSSFEDFDLKSAIASTLTRTIEEYKTNPPQPEPEEEDE